MGRRNKNFVACTIVGSDADWFIEDMKAQGFGDNAGLYLRHLVLLGHVARKAFENGDPVFVPSVKEKTVHQVHLPHDIVPTGMTDALFEKQMRQAFGGDTRSDLFAVLKAEESGSREAGPAF
jgi:hypothetical protein